MGFGAAIYLAEDVEKIDQYTTVDESPTPQNEKLHEMLWSGGDNHPGNVHYALVCQVVLGVPVRVQDVNTGDGLSPHNGKIFAFDGQNNRQLRCCCCCCCCCCC